MSYLASAGHERSPGERRLFEVWVLETIENVWTEFAREFLELWRTEGHGDAYPQTLFPGVAGAARLEVERQAYRDGCSVTPWDFRLQKSSAAFSGWRTMPISN